MYNQVTDFVHQLFGTSETVPLHAPLFIGNEKKYLNECIDTTFVSSVGKFVDRFEEDEIETEDAENVENAGEEQENGDE